MPFTWLDSVLPWVADQRDGARHHHRCYSKLFPISTLTNARTERKTSRTKKSNNIFECFLPDYATCRYWSLLLCSARQVVNDFSSKVFPILDKSKPGSQSLKYIRRCQITMKSSIPTANIAIQFAHSIYSFPSLSYQHSV